MTKQEFDEMAALVVRLRKELEHTNQHLVAHIDALTKSNAQCGEYLRRNEQLHSELVEVRAALASVTEQRDSLRRTLDEWERADTKPHALIDPPIRMGLISETGPVVFVRIGPKPADDDVADHVAPPVLPMCMTCHHCGNALDASVFGPYNVCTTIGCPRTVTNNDDGSDKNPYDGPCHAGSLVRHE